MAPLKLVILSIFAVFSNKFLKCPKFNNNVLAAFFPIPGTPGMLSDGSPSRAFISATNSGPNPSYLSLTALLSYVLISPNPEYISTFVLVFTNCNWSASPVNIKHCKSFLSAIVLIVPTRSSASNPSCSNTGIFIDERRSFAIGICL